MHYFDKSLLRKPWDNSEEVRSKYLDMMESSKQILIYSKYFYFQNNFVILTVASKNGGIKIECFFSKNTINFSQRFLRCAK